jgi:uncharacterized repeat protein (TIGR03843 family)
VDPGDQSSPEDPGSPEDQESTVTYEATIAPEDTAGMVELLSKGDLEVIGRMPWSSNGTFYVQVRLGDDFAPGVYKPGRGERPLWDFPSGLWKREIAMWELSEVLGFALVPPTVLTEGVEGFGPGSLQAFVPADFSEHYFTVREQGLLDKDTVGTPMRRLCAMDIVANSTDRKAGHCLFHDERVWAIDNGLSFHTEFKLRTVIWDFSGEAIPDDILDPVERLVGGGTPLRLARWLDHDELDALCSRASGLLGSRVFPTDPSGQRIPWPLV